MATWSATNRACKTIWSTLKTLEQNNKPFDVSGTVKMAELSYWNPTASSDMQKLQATSLANEIDNILITIRLAKYEEGTSKEKAINDIVNSLLNEQMILSEFAEVIDKAYLFFGE